MSAAAGAAAAAAKRRAERKEEEQMTGYTATELADGWEFKILRSATGAFKKPEVLRAVLEEVGRAGWVMIEKFDTHRLRLKRPASAKAGDAALGFDAYRTSVGMSETRMAFVIAGCVVVVPVLLVIILAVLGR